MTAEAVWQDLYCHILLKSNLSWDFLFLCVYGEVSECNHMGRVTFPLSLSLVSYPLLQYA